MKKLLSARVLSIIIAAVLCISLIALSGFSRGGSSGVGLDDDTQEAIRERDIDEYSDDVTVIRVDMHGWTPTTSSTSSSGSGAFVSPRYIANWFEDYYDMNVKIEWVRDKDISVTTEKMSEYFQLQLTSKTTPSIAFTWGTSYQDLGWYIDLTNYLEEENKYEKALAAADLFTDSPLLNNTRWKDSFEDYLWDLDSITQFDGKIVAIPITLFDGTASAIFYNIDTIKNLSVNYLLDSNGYLGIEEPLNFTKWIQIVNAANAAGDKSRVVDAQNYPYVAGSWLFQFELGPAYMSYVEATYNGGKRYSGAELLQAVIDDKFNPATQPYADELFTKLYQYLSFLSDSSTSLTNWSQGTAAAQVSGTWAFSDNMEQNPIKNGKFKWQMAPTTVIDDSEYTRDYVTWGSLDDAQPAADLYLNVMKAGVTKDGTLDGEIDEDKLFYSVEFLKLLTTWGANGMMIEEMDTSFGAVKGVERPAWINNPDVKFADCKFAKTTATRGWPSGFTLSATTQMSSYLSKWMKGSIDKQTFYTNWNKWQKISAKAMAEALGITLVG